MALINLTSRSSVSPMYLIHHGTSTYPWVTVLISSYQHPSSRQRLYMSPSTYSCLTIGSSLKRKEGCDNRLIVTEGVEGCHFDSLQRLRWRSSSQLDYNIAQPRNYVWLQSIHGVSTLIRYQHGRHFADDIFLKDVVGYTFLRIFFFFFWMSNSQ